MMRPFWIIYTASIFSITLSYSQSLDNLSNELRLKIENGQTSRIYLKGEVLCCRDAVPKFYYSRIFEPVWDAFLANQLIEVIKNCEREGLNPRDYHIELLRSFSVEPPQTPVEQVEYELLLTDSFLLFASHLMSGKVDPQTIDSQWKTINREGDPIAALQRALETRDVVKALQDLRPNYKSYQRLISKLELYRQLRDEGGWEKIPEGESLTEGMASPRVELLRKRLRSTGELGKYTFEDPEIMDEEVTRALKKFQKRHGIEPDGVLGKSTLTELNVEVERRIESIMINLERCRWLPRSLGDHYIMVNIPAFEMEVIRDQEIKLEMNVAVGKPYRQTPVFSARILYLVFNPYWTVPPTILSQDIIPAQQKDPGYLHKLNIKVVASDGTIVDASTIDWNTIKGSSFPYQLRQEPGPNNALGQVKFIFPNPYNVYMHDTNHRELLAKTERALSSGCIRLSKPIDLAKYLLDNWSEKKVEESLKNQKNQTVMLPSPVQVHLQYWTSFIDENGTLHFRKDIYERDQRVLKELLEAPPTAI